MKSNALIYTSIIVTAFAIVVVLVYLFLPSSFKESPNSQTYIALISVLAVATTIFGLVQAIPLWLKSRRNKDQSLEALEIEVKSHELYRKQKTLEDAIESKQQNYPVKVTIEVKGTPMTIESSDVSKVEDIIKHLTHDMVGPTHFASEAKASTGIVRENEGTYNVDDTSA